MSSILLHRRSFLAGAGLAWLSGLTPAGAENLNVAQQLLAAAYKAQDGAYGVAILNEHSNIVSAHPLPTRGHGFASNPQAKWVVAFSRRPGNFALAIHRKDAVDPIGFQSGDGRHFYGHGAFSADGLLLYASENAYETGDGVIGIYDATDHFKRMGEFPSHGIGPHEIILMPDGKTLCVANGGIRTHPDQGRQKLNLPTMAPSMALIDTQTGSLLSSHALPKTLHRLSLRHIAVDRQNQVWIGGQYEGDAADQVPVLTRLDADGQLKSVPLPDDVALTLGQYVGSVAVSNDGQVLALASPKSGVFLTLDTKTANVLDVKASPGTCGIHALGSGFITSSANGRFGNHNFDRAWDNHISAV